MERVQVARKSPQQGWNVSVEVNGGDVDMVIFVLLQMAGKRVVKEVMGGRVEQEYLDFLIERRI
jgi:hypothetical protein